MKKIYGLILTALMLTSLMIGPNNVMSYFTSQVNGDFGFHGRFNQVFTKGENIFPTNLSLQLSTDKESYYRGETVFVTARLCIADETPVSNATITYEVRYPNGTLWFVWTDGTDQEGTSTLTFLLDSGVPSGKYQICSSGYKAGLGSAYANLNFTVVNCAPQIFSVVVTPKIIETPTNVNVFANAGDFEDDVNINVKCLISMPNGTAKQLTFVFNGTCFTLTFPVKASDPLGTYHLVIIAEDSEGTLSNPYRDSFENAISINMGSLIVNVVNSEGLPISHATLILVKQDAYLIYKNSSDDNGYAFFKRVIPGNYILKVFGPKYAENISSITVLENRTVALKTVLKKLPIIKGYVTSESEIPIVNAKIEAITLHGSAVINYTDQNGFFMLVLPSAGTFLVKASATGYSKNSTLLEVELERERWVNFSLKENGAVKGKIIDGLTKLPIANATVFLGKHNYLGVSVMTDQYGNFLFSDVLPGDYVIRGIADNYLSNSCSISVSSGETVYVELELTPAGKVQGAVFDADTRLPIQGAKVALINSEGAILTVYKTDENGVYCFKRVNPGNYTIKVYAYGYNSAAQTLYVSPYVSTEVNFNLIPNMIFIELYTRSNIYSRGETIEFALYIRNPMGQSIVENITETELYLINPLNEIISVALSRNIEAFNGTYFIPIDAPIGVWLVIACVKDAHGNIAEDVKTLAIAEAFYIDFETDRESYTRYENVSFFATIARYSDLSRLLGANEVNVTVSILNEFNITLLELSLAPINNVFSTSCPLNSFEVGNYTARLTVKDNNGNEVIVEKTFKVVYDFTISLYTDKNVYNRTENVRIYGFAIYETGFPVSNRTVTINLCVKGFNRYYSAVTDETGYFEFIFKPSGVDAGNYTVNASILSDGITREASGKFVILGLILKPSKITVKMPFNSQNDVVLNVGNIGETTLTGVSASISLGEADGVTAEIPLPPKSTIAPGEWSAVTIRLAAALNSTFQTQFIFEVSSSQGAIETAVIDIYLYPAVPVALVKPQVIETSLNPGSFHVYSVNITNVGFGEMINVHLTEPSLPWIYLTTTNLGNISPYETSIFDIIINPPSNISVGIYEDQVAILSDNHVTIYIYLVVTLTHAEKGALLFHVADELGNPVSKAKITLQYQESYAEILSAETNATGFCIFAGLTVGRYSYFISKDGHNSASGTVTVTPGEPIIVEALLPVKVMDVSFEVAPITIGDQYIITLNLTFQTEIPPPILISIPPAIQYSADRAYVYNNGYTSTACLTIVNVGAISVYNVTLYVDYVSAATSGYAISLFDFGEAINIEEIKAKESLSIPVTIRIEAGTLITELPQGLIGKIKIQGNFVYFDHGSDIPHKARTRSEALIYIFDVGARRLCLDPPVIYGINQEGVISFGLGAWPSRLPDVIITNCAENENVSVCTVAAGAGITVFVGLDLTEILLQNGSPIDVGGFVAFGLITRYGPLPGEGITLVDAEDTFGLFSAEIQGGPLYSLLLQALIMKAMDMKVIGFIELSPSKVAILQSEMWNIPTSWTDLFEQLIDFKIRIGAELTVGGILFAYKWQFDTSLSFYLVPIFIVDVSFPMVFVPLITRNDVIVSSGGTVAGMGHDQVYVFYPPAVEYETRPIVRRVEPTIVHTVYETVKLSISQEAALERDAFAATLKMKNKLTDLNIENVNVELKITSLNGSDMLDKFYISSVSLENINSIDGTGTILPNNTATVRWLIIPKIGAGGNSPDGEYYFVQAFVTYTVNGTNFSVNSTKELINVKPQPLLVLEYYVPSEVKANQPFKLAVKVTNVGNGTARNVQIDTIEPVIYDNESGLRIKFEIIGSMVKGQLASKSLKVKLGDIPPGECVVVYWIMTTTLDGTFLNFSASFTHLNELGGAETSLIKEVKTYILMGDVKTEKLDFLFLVDVNADSIPDELLNPIDGDITEVVDVSYTVIFTPGEASMVVKTQKIEDRWIFVDIEDPYFNMVSVLKIVRSDGKELDPLNYWMANGKICFVDDPEQNYTIYYNVHDVAIVDVSVSSTSVFQGDVIIIDVTVTNQGISPETFTLTVYINSTVLNEITIPELGVKETSILTFYWNTTGFEMGNYVLVVNASILLEEFDVLDNRYPSIIVQVKPPSKPSLVIIDRAVVSGKRVDVNTTQTISFHASWDSGGDVVGGKIYVNGTEYVTNQTGWISFDVCFATVGMKSWAVTSVDCGGVTNFAQTVDNPVIIWDRVNINLFSVVDARINIGEAAKFIVSGVYEFDNEIWNGTYVLNDTVTKNVVGKYWYTITSITDTKYGLTRFIMTAPEVYVIFDKVNIVLNISDNRIDVGQTASITYTATYEFDGTSYDGNIVYNDTLTKNEVGKYWFTVQSISGDSHGITVFESNSVYCIWDKILVYEGGVSHSITNVTQSETIWFRAKYAFDDLAVTAENGVLYVNGSEMIWSPENKCWQRQFSFSSVGMRTFVVSQVVDLLYGLKTFDDMVGPLEITWVNLAYYILKPPTPERPLIINASESINLTIIIEDISEPSILVVKTLQFYWEPPKGHALIGQAYMVNATGNPTGKFRIRIYYSDEQLERLGIEERTLKIFVWNGTAWIPLASSHVNPSKNYVEATVTHFSVFAIFGEYANKGWQLLIWILMLAAVFLVTLIILLILMVRKRRAVTSGKDLGTARNVIEFFKSKIFCDFKNLSHTFCLISFSRYQAQNHV